MAKIQDIKIRFDDSVLQSMIHFIGEIDQLMAEMEKNIREGKFENSDLENSANEWREKYLKLKRKYEKEPK